MLSTRYSSQSLMNLEYSGQIFKVYTDIKFNENPSSGSPSCFMQTDRQDYIQSSKLFFVFLYPEC